VYTRQLQVYTRETPVLIISSLTNKELLISWFKESYQFEPDKLPVDSLDDAITMVNDKHQKD